ncbi:hypothetical protein PDIG_91140 [Penicillium digitatum PHI26]|uniref:Uncharacterized protein n=2 Tax=Penicillium digitatum TaxID=36651 RepID=K9F7U6_PEND2|nr:hypothetical protein PDIP_08060 [Penicillium digitatum Pd1]EKV04137.1 hypothetical protein PDIG_91140 [Penicillium digitatum PHI26]EKV21280.1 hypothetical protein PDIP_08060 [Penicillium digitatum Pd1]
MVTASDGLQNKRLATSLFLILSQKYSSSLRFLFLNRSI